MAPCTSCRPSTTITTTRLLAHGATHPERSLWLPTFLCHFLSKARTVLPCAKETTRYEQGNIINARYNLLQRQIRASQASDKPAAAKSALLSCSQAVTVLRRNDGEWKTEWKTGNKHGAAKGPCLRALRSCHTRRNSLLVHALSICLVANCLCVAWQNENPV